MDIAARIRTCFFICLGLFVNTTCSNNRSIDVPIDSDTRHAPSSFHVAWNPATGRGPITQLLSGGDRFTLCLQCGYPNYTGGLVIGNFGGSGFEWVPAAPPAGFSTINLFCALDESILERTACREYNFGWSQNFGSGDDGEPLLFRGGEVLDDGPERVILGAINASGCFHLTRFMRWGGGESFISIATTISNTCDKPLVFDYWTGDDPWIGRYRSAEGDVGWYDEGIVNHETFIEADSFTAGGLYDLGNTDVGEVIGAFSNAANFIMPNPENPPNRVIFASGFLHDLDEIVSDAPLDPTSMIAINLGWTDVHLGPGEKWMVGYALGRAITGSPGEVPRPPDVNPEAWSFLNDALTRFKPTSSIQMIPRRHHKSSPIRFVAEDLQLTIGAGSLEVHALYSFHNDGSETQSQR